MQLLDASRLALAGATIALQASAALPRVVPARTTTLSLLAYAAVLAVLAASRAGWLDSAALGVRGPDEEPAEVALFACTFAWTLLLLVLHAVPSGSPVAKQS